MQLPELVQLNIPFILILLTAFAAAAVAFYLYRRTIPDVKTGWRVLLAILRGLVLFFVFGLLFSPRLHLEYKKITQRTIAVFVDQSQSMRVKDDGLSRLARERRLVRQIRSFETKNNRCLWFGFDDRVFPLNPDSLSARPRGTNLEQVLKKIENLEPDAAILLTDGNVTTGAPPEAGDFRLTTPIFTVGLGDTAPGPDVFVSDVYFRPVAYQGKLQRLKVQVGSLALNGAKQVRVRFEVNGAAVALKKVKLSGSGAEQEVVFDYAPAKIGLQKLRFVIEKIAGEENTANNHRTVVQRVLKSRLKIAVLTGRPDYESKFMRLLLSGQEDFDCRLFAQDKNGRWIGTDRNPQFSGYDILILSDFPTAVTRAADIQKISSLIKKENPGLLLRFGSLTDGVRLKSFLSFLGIKEIPANTKPRKTLEYLPAATEPHPILQIFDTPETVSRFWQNLPPLLLPVSEPKLTARAEVLLRAVTGKGEQPVIIVQNKNRRKSALWLGSGYWRWYFLLQDEPELKEGYRNMLRRTVRWLSEKQKLQPVVLDELPRQIYLGQDVALTAHLYDADFNPVPDGNVRFDIRWQGQSFTVQAKGDSGGVYRARFSPPGEGKYEIVATGMKNDTPIGNDRQEIGVIPFEKELLNTTQNKPLLMRLSAQTNGVYLSPTQTDSLRKLFNTAPRQEMIVRDVDVWYRPLLLLLILTAIVAEWVIRKIKGLA